MRPLFHPSVEDVTVEAILHALSDPVRVAIFAQIDGSECSQNCSNFLNMSERTIPKSTLSQHFKALRDAGLIRGERRGIEMHNTSRRGNRQALSRTDCGDCKGSQHSVGTKTAG